MKYKKLFFSLTCFLLALLFCTSQIRLNNEALAKELAPQVLRFHIMANSDSKTDQKIKLEVRSLILDHLRNTLPKNADKQDTVSWLNDHKTDIETLADAYLAQNGCSYHTSLKLTNCYFPSRYYRGITFPCGMYDAARITLGNGNGHNWWCVLYPRYCFVDEALEQTQKGAPPLSKEQRPIVKFRIKLLSLFNPH